MEIVTKKISDYKTIDSVVDKGEEPWYKQRVVEKSVSGSSGLLTSLGFVGLYNKLLGLKGVVVPTEEGAAGSGGSKINFWRGTSEQLDKWSTPQVWEGIHYKIATEAIYADPTLVYAGIVAAGLTIAGAVYGSFTLGRKLYNKLSRKEEIKPDISGILDKIEQPDISDIIDVPSGLEQELDA